MSADYASTEGMGTVNEWMKRYRASFNPAAGSAVRGCALIIASDCREASAREDVPRRVVAAF
ncbi:hypothetical protein OEE53_005023, partial [Pseudomonas aeruginosa]